MFCAGHLITSTALAAVSSKRLSLKFVPLTVMLMLTNFIDIDHLLYYYKDDGAANSLALHPLHLYAGVLIFIIFVIGLVKINKSNLILAIIGGVSLHLSLDAFAHSIGYNIPILISLDVINITILCLLVKKLQGDIPIKRFILYMTFVMIGTSFVQWYIKDILLLIPQENIVVYIATPVMTVLSAMGFGLVFKRYVIS